MFRLPCVESVVHAALRLRGYTEHDPTWVMGCTLQDDSPVLHAADELGGLIGRVDVLTVPSPAWCAVFLGPGFDPADGAARAAHLGRASGTRFYAVGTPTPGISQDQQTALHAVGAACWHGGWVGIHGMRTLAAVRGRGMARAILQRMAQEAWAAEQRQIFLQVGADNPARHLYQRLGFEHRWTYAYWRHA